MKPFKPTKAHRQAKIKEAVKLLAEIVKIKLAPSPIHGVGVFAIRNIKKGEKLYTDIIPHKLDVPYSKLKKLDKEIVELIMGQWPQILNGSLFLYPVTKFAAYLNHAPTKEQINYDVVNDVALKNIPKGTEVLEDYTVIPNYDKIFTWLVKSKKEEEKE